MKFFLGFLLCFFIQNPLNSQVVFCPPGAEWNYNFAGFSKWLRNETIKYTGDTVLGADTVKILSHKYYFYNCNYVTPNATTYLKQKGDTVFFRNITTSNSWQILYNFACQPGGSWQTTARNLDDNNIAVTSTFSVSAVGTVTVNNRVLRTLKVGSDYITERLGPDKFFFMFWQSGTCEGDIFNWSLCYRDDSFGLKQYRDLDCKYAGTVGLGENSFNKNIFLSPNPCNNELNIRSEDPEIMVSGIDLIVQDLSGRIVMNPNSMDGKISTRELSKGIYFVKLYKDQKLIASQKIIKE